MGKKIIWLLLLVLIPLTSSLLDNEVQSNLNSGTGIQIDYPRFVDLTVNKSYNLSFEVYNLSNGSRITAASCNLTLTNHTGQIILNMATSLIGIKYNLLITSGNFSLVDLLDYHIYCETGGIGGFTDGTLNINRLGKSFTTAQSVVYSSFFLLFSSFFIIILFGINKLPSSNTTDEQGQILKISYLKHLRPILWVFEWFLVIGIMFLASNLGFAFLGESLFANFFFMIYRVMFMISPLIIVLWVLWMVAQIIQDKRIKELWGRGMFSEEGYQ